MPVVTVSSQFWKRTTANKNERLIPCNAKNEEIFMNLCSRARLAVSVITLASVAIVGPASALTLYDGDWSVVIVTRSGACDPS